MAGNKNSGRKGKRFEFEVNRLKELSLKRAIRILEQEQTDDEKLNKALNQDQQEITLKVIDKALVQEVKLGSDGTMPSPVISVAIVQGNPDANNIQAPRGAVPDIQ